MDRCVVVIGPVVSSVGALFHVQQQVEVLGELHYLLLFNGNIIILDGLNT